MTKVRAKRFPVEKWDGENISLFKKIFSEFDLDVVDKNLNIRRSDIFKLRVGKGSWVTVSDKGYPSILTKKEFEKHAMTPPSGRCYVYSLEIQERLLKLDARMTKLEIEEIEEIGEEFSENISIIKWVDDKSIKNFKRMLPDYLITKFKIHSEVFLSLQKEFIFARQLSQGEWIAVSKDGYPLVLTPAEVERYVKNEDSECLSICSSDIVKKLAILDSEMKELQYAAAAEEIPAVQIPFVHWTGASSKKLEKLQSMFPEFTISHYLGNLSFKDSNDFVKDYGKSVILTYAPNGYPFELTQGECNYYGNYDEFDFIYDYDIETIIKVRIKRLQNLL